MADIVMNDEKNKVLITSTYIKVNKNTYPIGGLTSVSSGKIYPKTGIANFVSFVGFLTIICAVFGELISSILFYTGYSNPDLGVSCPVIGLVINILFMFFGLLIYKAGVNSAKKAKAQFYIVLGTAAGEQRALLSYDEAFVKKIEETILNVMK